MNTGVVIEALEEAVSQILTQFVFSRLKCILTSPGMFAGEVERNLSL